jgi:hypothetical protein
MAKCFFEIRKQSARGTDSIAADIMRHLHARQYVGKAVVVCDQPVALLAASRKQWLKLTRAIQKQRASTLNADKILKYTHTITRMQHVRFTFKTPLDDPEADVYFLDPVSCELMPPHCYSTYVVTPMQPDAIKTMIEQIPSESLVIDYDHTTPWAQYGLQSKVVLEEQVQSEWHQVQHFLQNHHIDAVQLAKAEVHDVEAMDDALDMLLGISHQFLRIANEFQRSLELARPLRINLAARKEYDSIMLLAYRVQALSPGAFTQHFLETFNEDDTFFLSDDIARLLFGSNQDVANAVREHYRANRKNLAKALLAKAGNL